jgi:hypothetical protein
MVLRVDVYGTEQAVSFPPDSLGGELFSIVKAAAQEFAAQLAARSSGSSSVRLGTDMKSVARDNLSAALDRIRRTARAIALEAPELASQFRIPPDATDQELLATAQAFAKDAVQWKSTFISYAMPADFIDELNADIDDFKSAMNRQEKGKGHKVMARVAFDEALDRALSAIRRLDAIVRNTFHNDPVKLAGWERARHVERTPRSKPAPVAAASTK